MKNFALILALFSLPALAQEGSAGRGYHTHDGFYLSLNPGLAVGNTVFNNNGFGPSQVTFRGGGTLGDIKIGSAVTPNLIVSYDMILHQMSRPDIKADGGVFATDGDFSIRDLTAGFGLTYYFMPANSFVSSTFGVGNITMHNAAPRHMLQSDPGPAFSLKVGKEWWVSKNWGLGVSGGYGFSGGKDRDFDGTFAAHKVFVLFNTTYN